VCKFPAEYPKFVSNIQRICRSLSFSFSFHDVWTYILRAKQTNETVCIDLLIVHRFLLVALHILHNHTYCVSMLNRTRKGAEEMFAPFLYLARNLFLFLLEISFTLSAF